MKYIVSIDQSTQGTKGLLFDNIGKLLARTDIPHKQIIDDKGWVEHDPEEIYRNTIAVIKQLVEKSGIDKDDIHALGISNQRETAVCWDKDGVSVYNAVVWQCARGETIMERLRTQHVGFYETLKQRTGLPASPYFSAAKIAWVIENVAAAQSALKNKTLHCGTVDSFLVYRLTGGKDFKTDYSNASRTQLFNINNLCWDEEICTAFNIPLWALPSVCPSDSCFGETTLEGFLEKPIPIHGVLGDSHAALFGQGCTQPGMIKTTYGSGSSVMMNVGKEAIHTEKGIASSIGWHINGELIYVLEGNINYTGSVVTWLKDDLKLITTPHEADLCAEEANPKDNCFLVPAFTGLSAPHYDSGAKAMITGMTRATGKNEFCRAALDSIAYQITDILNIMREVSNIEISELRVDGGPTKSEYLMTFQCDIAGAVVSVPHTEELSGIGAAYAAGVGIDLYDTQKLSGNLKRKTYTQSMSAEVRKQKLKQWYNAVKSVLSYNN